jgi:hypothetical protein
MLELMLFKKADNMFLLGCFLCLFTVWSCLSLSSACVTGEITMFYGCILRIIIESKIPRYRNISSSAIQHLSIHEKNVFIVWWITMSTAYYLGTLFV